MLKSLYWFLYFVQCQIKKIVYRITIIFIVKSCNYKFYYFAIFRFTCATKGIFVGLRPFFGPSQCSRFEKAQIRLKIITIQLLGLNIRAKKLYRTWNNTFLYHKSTETNPILFFEWGISNSENSKNMSSIFLLDNLSKLLVELFLAMFTKIPLKITRKICFTNFVIKCIPYK